MNALRKWMDKATAAQTRDLARLAGTTVGTLRQIAGSYRTGGEPSVTPQLARRIEIAATKVPGRELPQIHREHLAPACASCEFAKQCRKTKGR